MNWELLAVALATGAANWVFRALPILTHSNRETAEGPFQRFLSATGPAAIATLFVASILPTLSPDLDKLLPTAIGTLVVLGIWRLRTSVVLATLGGAFAFGFSVWLLA